MKKHVEKNPELAEYYRQELLPVYEKLEKERQAGLKTFICNAVIIFLIAVGICLLYCFNVLDLIYFIGIACSLFTATLLFLGYPIYKYNKTAQSYAMDKVLAFWGKFKYSNKENFIDKASIKKSELFRDFNSVDVDEAFSGEYHGTSLAVAENTLSLKGEKQSIIAFRGILLMLDFPKSYQRQILALQKGRNINIFLHNPLHIVAIITAIAISLLPYYALSGESSILAAVVSLMFLISLLIGFYFLLIRIRRQKAVKKVVLEGLPFMKKWQVYTDNQVEARYILTPLFMEKMLEIKRLFHGYMIDFSFFNSKLLIAVHTRKNMFATTSIFSSALSLKKMQEVVNQLQSIFAIIDIVLGDNQEITK